MASVPSLQQPSKRGTRPRPAATPAGCRAQSRRGPSRPASRRHAYSPGFKHLRLPKTAAKASLAHSQAPALSGPMKQTALTPVERGILLILMAAGLPVEQAQFKEVHGLSVRKNHRNKLVQLGLIDVGKERLAFSLTGEGWAWLKRELSAPRPGGVLGLGPLYAVLGALGRLTERLEMPLEAGFGPEAGLSPKAVPCPAPSAAPAKAPAEAGLSWSDIDEPLARALQDIAVFATNATRFKNAAKSSFEREFAHVEGAANLVFQSVKLAAAKRKLDLDGQPGSETRYDPVLFHSDDLVKLGEPVRIRKSAVTRGHGKAKVIVQPGLADALIDSK
jgi:hypothetical protein